MIRVLRSTAYTSEISPIWLPSALKKPFAVCMSHALPMVTNTSQSPVRLLSALSAGPQERLSSRSKSILRLNSTCTGFVWKNMYCFLVALQIGVSVLLEHSNREWGSMLVCDPQSEKVVLVRIKPCDKQREHPMYCAWLMQSAWGLSRWGLKSVSSAGRHRQYSVSIVVWAYTFSTIDRQRRFIPPWCNTKKILW